MQRNLMSDNEITLEIPLDIWKQNYVLLVASRENIIELLNHHETPIIGAPNKKEIAISKMYEAELSGVDNLIAYTENTFDVAP